MEVKNLFDPITKQEIVDRINKLSNQSQRQWGKMDVAQILAHCQMPLSAAIGTHTLKRNFFLSLIGPMYKPMMYNNKPFKKNLPTDPSFKITDAKDFDKEKQQLLKLIGDFSERNITGKPHPFFGKLTHIQWSMGNWKHLDHHLQQFGV